MQFPHIDPVFLSIGPLQFRWYGLMYVLTFVVAYFIISSETTRKKLPLTKDDVADLVFYGAMGVVLGGRLGYILFYNLGFYLNNPLKLFAVWEGGMSFHGGILGVILAFLLFAHRKKLSFLTLIDMAALCSPVGLGLGRIGNFINGELYGRPTNVAWGMVFPGSDGLARHPSQLYEAFLEGIVLFIIVRVISRCPYPAGVSAWTFVAGYGLFRFIVEFFRQPDVQIGLYFGMFSQGQLLSLPMFLIGTFMVFKLSHQKQRA
jgi:phosphatidylglycerol:prolipoprotein diacylglycerol transferase